MIEIRPFKFLVFELFEEEIQEVRNDYGFWQLRLRGYFKDHKVATTRQMKQMGLKNGTKQSLINGFSVCGRKEQLEYLKAYILKELEHTKAKVYSNKVVELSFGYGYFNIAYFMGRRSVYGYKFDFNFRTWCSYNKDRINQNTLKELEPTFEKIYNDYAWEREKFEQERERALEFIKQKKLQELIDNESSMLDCDIESFADELREELVDKSDSELKDIINKRKIVLDIENE